MMEVKYEKVRKKFFRGVFRLYSAHPGHFNLDKGGTFFMQLSKLYEVRAWKFHRQDFSPGH